MSTNNDLITRRTVFVTAAGAACTLLMPPARADDELPQRRGPYRIEDWGKTWLNPNKARVLARVPAIAMPDIAGYWPRTTRPVRGPQEYATRIIDLLDFIPDFRAEPIEHATVRGGRHGSDDRSQRLRCGKSHSFGSSDLRGIREARGRLPRRVAIRPIAHEDRHLRGDFTTDDCCRMVPRSSPAARALA
jgi:hypothetical protein